MASEISVDGSVSVTKNGASFSARAQKVLDQTGNQTVHNVQNIGTSAELIALGDIAGTPSTLFVQNLDTTNYVELSLNSGMTQRFATLRAGEFLLLRPSSASIYAAANTSAVNILVLSTEA